MKAYILYNTIATFCILSMLAFKTVKNQQSDAYCKVINGDSLSCEGFDKFESLELSKFKPDDGKTFNQLKFVPSKPLVLNDSLDLTGLSVTQNYDCEFQSISGIDIQSNPFAILDVKNKPSLTFKLSKFELLFQNKPIDLNTCNYIIQNELFISLFLTSNIIILDSPTYSTLPNCLIYFNGSMIDDFQISNVSPTNRFTFFNNSLLNLTDDFKFLITKFGIDKSDLVLDENLLNKMVFKNMFHLSITDSYIRYIQSDLFGSFDVLKVLEMKLLNIEPFLAISSNNNWMSYLNPKVNVDLNNSTDVSTNLEYKMIFYLTDLNEYYEYPDDDLCLFKEFPHEHLVAPVLIGKENLKCTCTLLWLLKYKHIYDQAGINPMVTSATSVCLSQPNFDQLVESCNFERKFKNCNPYCKVTQGSKIKCERFSEFKQLDFSNFTPDDGKSFDEIKFYPMYPIILDNSLNLGQINVTDYYYVEFVNVYSINLLSNPFAELNPYKKTTLVFTDSRFEFLYQNQIIDVDKCNYLLQNEIYISILDTSFVFGLNNPSYQNYPMCPIIFQAATVETFAINNINIDNQFSFMDTSALNFSSFFTSDVRDLIISDSDFVLDQTVLDINVFSNLNLLLINNSNIRYIQEDLFKYFTNLKYVNMQLTNFVEVISLNSYSNWLASLNSNITVDLNDTNQVNENKKFFMEFTLTDKNELYDYPEKDFCLFKKFPHEKLVAPIIMTKDNLECTCTLLYLLKYKDIYNINGINVMDTPSVAKCLYAADFADMVKKCDFYTKLNECDKSNKKKESSDGYLIATVVLGVLSGVFLVLIVVAVYFFKIRKARKPEDDEITFSEIKSGNE